VWISQDFSTTSKVYAALELLENRCVHGAAKVDRNVRVPEKAFFAHSILWICIGFSTG
jgi:hypothetical protein